MTIKRDPRPDKTKYPKCKNINIRVTANEHKRIKDTALNKGFKNITDFMEHLIFGKQK